jgi:CRISPR-associated protein Csb2
MFAIAVELLAERYTATQFNDRNNPEWPPHPARLFSAMVAAWADSDEPDRAERAALQWLEEQDPPAIHCGEGRRRRVVTHFVPVNDPTALARESVVSGTYSALSNARHALVQARESGEDREIRRAETVLVKAETKAKSDASRAGKVTGRESVKIATAVTEVLPEFRGKQGRTYPSVIPDKTTIWFVWAGAKAGASTVNALDAVLSRVARLGHSSTLVSCRCVTGSPPPTWVPGRGEDQIRLRVPRAGLLDRLERAFSSHHGEEPRTLPAGMMDYRHPGEKRRLVRSPLLGGDWYVLGITGSRLPSAVQTLAITRALRASLLAHGRQPPPEVLSGHRGTAGKESTPPLDRPHLAVVPLLNAGNPYSDGAMHGVALVLPSECSDDDRAALEQALRSWSAAGFDLLLSRGANNHSVRLRLEDLGIERSERASAWLEGSLAVRRRTTRRDYWCRESRRWLTVTPVSLDRFPGNLSSAKPGLRDRAEAEAVESVALACVYAGIADRPEEVQVRIRLDSPLTGIPASPAGANRASRGSRRYPGYRTGSGIPRACVHAEIEFPEPVQGPVLIGAGRYFGYGLCLPCDRREEAV